MPRTLPWMVQQESARTPSPRRSIDSPKTTQKRARISEVELESEKEATPSSSKKQKARVPADERTPPSSPPPEHLPEAFMHEGVERDDRYRMVEDEFLATAQQFTVHLHAAEYKRQEKIARARNAETISSISRPVTQAMTDRTKRKLETIEKSKTQKNAIQTLLGENGDDVNDLDESSDGEGLAYFNTTLRGLMDSPRRQSATLSKLPYGIATRAAAGFQKPAAHRDRISSPVAAYSRQQALPSNSNHGSSTESSDFEDDLDAPVPTVRNASRRRIFTTSSSPSSPLPQTTQPKSSTASRPVQPHLPSSEDKQASMSNDGSSQSVSNSQDQTTIRVRRRLEQSQLDRRGVKQEKNDEDKKDKGLNLIPTFL